MCVSFKNDYYRLLGGGPRLRDVPDTERDPRANDLQEKDRVDRIYRKALKITVASLLQDDLRRFDATVGDHLCQVVSAMVYSFYADPKIQEEARDLKDKLDLKEEIFISPEMSYLLRASLLNSGQHLEVARDGRVVLKIDANNVQNALGVKDRDFLTTMQKIVNFSKGEMNRQTVEGGELLGMCELSKEDAECLSDRYVQKAEGLLMKNPLVFPCAYYVTKASLLHLIKKGASIGIRPYKEKRGTTFVFTCSKQGEDGLPEMRLGERQPQVVIDAYFPEGVDPQISCRKIEEYGFFKYLLSSIASGAQFADLPPENKAKTLEEGLDLADLPPRQKEEIARYRQMGRKELGLMPKIVHFTASLQRGIGS